MNPLQMQLLSTGLKTFGGLLSGRDQQKAAEWNAAMSRYDAAQARVKAQLDEASIRREGEINELLRRRAEKLEIGSFRAEAGASGLAVDSPTNQAVVQDIMKRYELESELERRNIEWDASIIRYQGDVGVATSLAEAEMHELTGKRARLSSYIQTGATLLSDVAEMKRRGVLKVI